MIHHLGDHVCAQQPATQIVIPPYSILYSTPLEDDDDDDGSTYSPSSNILYNGAPLATRAIVADAIPLISICTCSTVLEASTMYHGTRFNVLSMACSSEKR
mmetsp:Transcript_32311/g.38584  ORF Transcript_32311/g.38584 Transcript_32311/m.38584 type:complete len:101 (-) Transcript_32311:55-357(-)